MAHAALCSSPYTMPTSGGCTGKPNHPFRQQKRSASRWTSRIGTDHLPMNATLSPMFLHSLLPPMALSTRTWAATLLLGTQSSMLLRLPNRGGKHLQQNILPPHWHVHQGPNRETTPAPCHQNSTMHLTQSQLGPHMVQPHQRQPHQTNDCICCCQRHLLLRLFLCHILEKNTDSCLALASATNLSAAMKGSTVTLHASSTPNWLTVFPKNGSLISSAVQLTLRWNSLSMPSLLNSWDEFDHDVQLHQVLCQPTRDCSWLQ